MKTVTKREISHVNWDISVKHLERKKILKKRIVQIYSPHYYTLEKSLKEEFVRSEVLKHTIESAKLEINKFNRFLAKNKN